MNKLLPILIPFIFFWGCQKNFNSVVDTQSLSNIRVANIGTANSFTYEPSDSLIVISIQLISSAGIQSVYANIIDPNFNQLNDSPLILNENGNNIYSNNFPLSHYYSKGTYQVQYFVTDENNNNYEVGLHSFNFDNGQANAAPVISNLIAPDTATIGAQKTLIFLSVQVQDNNGLSDVQSVFFNSFNPPDGHASTGNPFVMYDDGTNGDVTAGDGVYSLIIELLPTGVTKGSYRWEFQAKSKEGLLSNKIIHNIVIQ
jgi:hypothetical protein